MNAKFLPAVLALAMLAACGTPPPAAELSPLEKDGRALFARHCAACHSISGDTVIVGPPLAGIAQTAGGRVPGLDAAAYLEQSILEPGAYIVEGYADLMPPALAQLLRPEELRAIVAYMLTLE
ncbi:MAG: cytochrome c [Anaerolineales bacterium]|nr:cytochrome c [Anaerolineales bacterium]